MSGPSPLVLSILMIAGFLLSVGGIHLIVKRKETKQGALMLLAAAVAFVNVLIWAL